MNNETKEKVEKKEKTKTITEHEASLIVFNDDYNTFEFVILCFNEICKISYDEAANLAYTIHFNGQAVVKTGPYEEMKKMKDQ